MLNAWMWRAVNSYNSNKKEETINTHSNMDYSQVHYAKQRKPDTKDYTGYDSMHLKFLEKAKQ